MLPFFIHFLFFFFNDTATTEIYTLSLHDALPISPPNIRPSRFTNPAGSDWPAVRSEEHTSELQSRFDLVCRLLLEKKKKQTNTFVYVRKKKITDDRIIVDDQH